MSDKYNCYLQEHIENVRNGLDWMWEHDIVKDYPDVSQHDKSKYLDEEYEAYDDYFYGKEGKDEDDISVINDCFDYAWLHHIHNNPHHWQYWLLYEDNNDGKPKALEMEEKYVIEMIADWWSFSWAKGDLTEIFKWYDSHVDKIILHKKTRKLVEDILSKMEKIFEDQQEEKA